MYHIISQCSKGIFNAAFASVILKVYLGMFLKEKPWGRKRYLFWMPFWLWHFLWIWMTLNDRHFPYPVNSGIHLTCISILAVGNYQEKMRKKIGFAVTYAGIDALAEILVWFILSVIYSVEEMEYLWWGSFVSRGVTICAILVLHHFFKDKKAADEDERYNGYLLFVSLGSIFVVHTIFESYEQQGTGISLFYAVLSGIVMIGVNALVFLIHYHTWNIFELKKKNELFEYQLNLYGKYQKEQEANFLEIRRMRHDLRKDLLFLKELNRCSREEEIARFLDERLQTADQESKAVIHTNNLAVDALINDKYQSALKAGIAFDTDIQIPADLPFKGADLAVLLGNLLDNAQEAAESCEKKNAYISVCLYLDSGNLIVYVENSYDGKVWKNRENKYITRKDDIQNHGIGMGSIERIVEKYKGTMELSDENYIFKVKIILYGMEQHKI